MLLNRIKNYLNLFDLCCFNTGQTEITSTQRRIGFIFSIHISLALSFVYVKFQLFYYLCALIGFLPAINELVEYSGSLYTYWLIIFDSFVYRNAHKQLWLLFQRIEMEQSGTFTFHCYKIKFMEFLAASTVLIIYRLLDSIERFVVFIVYIIPVRICQIRIFYYILCLERIRLQLQQIERMCSLHFIENGRSHLKQLREKFQCVYETVELLNTIFGWSHVAAVAYSFFSIFTDSNYFYVHVNKLTVMDSIGKLNRYGICHKQSSIQ